MSRLYSTPKQDNWWMEKRKKRGTRVLCLTSFLTIAKMRERERRRGQPVQSIELGRFCHLFLLWSHRSKCADKHKANLRNLHSQTLQKVVICVKAIFNFKDIRFLFADFLKKPLHKLFLAQRVNTLALVLPLFLSGNEPSISLAAWLIDYGKLIGKKRGRGADSWLQIDSSSKKFWY